MNQPVYLTRNGRGVYAIVDMDELDRLKATVQLSTRLAIDSERGYIMTKTFHIDKDGII